MRNFRHRICYLSVTERLSESKADIQGELIESIWQYAIFCLQNERNSAASEHELFFLIRVIRVIRG